MQRGVALEHDHAHDDHAHDHGHGHGPDHGHDHPHPHDHGPAAPRRARSVGRWAGLGAVTTALVAGAVVLGSRHHRAPNAGLNAPKVPAAKAPSVPVSLAPATGTLAGIPAATPADAVTQFLHAEVAGDYSRSFGLLSADDQATLGPVDRWEGDHVEQPQYVSFDPPAAATVPATAKTATVTGVVHLHPELDQVHGMIPAVADVTWTAVRDGSGWRVGLSRAVIDPHLPDAAASRTAALAWVQARQGCTTAGELAGGLVGRPTAADELCHQTTTARVVADGSLSRLHDQSPVLTQFGPEAARWTHVVEVDGPAHLDVVLAPLGDQWLVIGVTDA